MGNKSKRKAGHLGFQAGEIAFIEDEMAALAAEYGLQVDGEVARNVEQRQASRKTRRRQVGNGFKSISATTNEQSSSAIHLLNVFNGPKDTDIDSETLIRNRLASVLPATFALKACGVPSCSCVHGGDHFSTFKEPTDLMTTPSNVFQTIQCLKCHHGVLQHTVGVRDDVDVATAWPNGGQRLFHTLYEHIRFGRIAASILKSRMWTKASVEHLDALQLHVKHHLTPDLEHEKHLLAALQTQLRKVQHAIKTASYAKLPILLACAFDQMYFPTYYAALVLFGRACGAVPAPDKYLKDLDRWRPNGTNQLEMFLNCIVANATVRARLLPPLALPLASSVKDEQERERRRNAIEEHENPLLAIYHARLREGVQLFYDEGMGMEGEMENALISGIGYKSINKHCTTKSNSRRDKLTSLQDTLDELPCYPLLKEWRTNCRDWCCHLYAYATPTPEAIELMAKYAPIVEMGAGTGYWSALLKRSNIDIIPYDKTPPGSEETGGNDYHGQVPTFCSLTVGTPDLLRTNAELHGRSLFLCYPPPNSDMALHCVTHFQGNVVLYVGEWQGDTANQSFEKVLETQFVLTEEMGLPNWGNSAYHLTVWHRKGTISSEKGTFWKAKSCFQCQKTRQKAQEEGNVLRRCRVCKTNVYCSWQCAEADDEAHDAEHALRLVFLDKKMGYKSMFDKDQYYQEVEGEGEEEEEEEEEEERLPIEKETVKGKETLGGGVAVETKATFAFDFQV